MVKKYLIRVIGALCILGVAVLMFVPSWVQMENVDRRELRTLRSDADGIYTAVVDDFTYELKSDDDFKDELKDFDLPYTRSKIKARFREIGDLTNQLLDREISLMEILTLSTAAPDLLEDVNNLLDSNCSETFFNSLAQYILFEGSQAIEYDYYSDSARERDLAYGAKQLEEMMEDAVDAVSEFSFVFVLLSATLILILVFAVLSAITHVCNKGRWVKYLFLVILVVMVVGVCLAAPAVSDLLVDAEETLPTAFADMTLGITVVPFFAIALMIAPIVLDIIFERKKETIIAEE